MTRSRDTWTPEAKAERILNRAMAHLKSVPYKVSLRWLFYRLLDEGIYTDKKDYRHLKDLCAIARHNWYNGWSPDSLADDTRRIYWKGLGAFDEEEAIDDIRCNYDKLQSQDYIVMILFEARAMHDQFRYYTKHLPLVPFGGDPSLPLKYELSMAVPSLIERYEKPVVMLYFGDYDEKGISIRKTAFEHIQKWCTAEYTLVTGGLTMQQVKKFNIPQNPDKPGYQWESLTDPQAREIITESLLKYHKPELCKEYEDMDTETLARWRERLK